MSQKMLRDQLIESPIPEWAICKHLTPCDIVAEFSLFVEKCVEDRATDLDNLTVADLFCGDGRLGYSVTRRLYSRYQTESSLLCVDISEPVFSSPSDTHVSVKSIQKDVFSMNESEQFDLIVANPPYHRLNRAKAAAINFKWDSIRSISLNLYSLSIYKAIQLCKDGGLVCVIAPYSWLTNQSDSGFRDLIKKTTNKVRVLAFSHRSVFSGVHQDIAFQCFWVDRTHKSLHNIEFSYKNSFPINCNSCNVRKDILLNNEHIVDLIKSVSVGSVVWNREKAKLTSKSDGGIPLLYAKNITSDNQIVFDSLESINPKQYISVEFAASVKKLHSPLVFIRRIMGGAPGNWRVYAAYYNSNLPICAENHVIVLELKQALEDPDALIETVKSKIADFYFYSGSPSISITGLKAALDYN
jgi:16S rRNA G966 N2-methylase RsmD